MEKFPQIIVTSSLDELGKNSNLMEISVDRLIHEIERRIKTQEFYATHLSEPANPAPTETLMATTLMVKIGKKASAPFFLQILTTKISTACIH